MRRGSAHLVELAVDFALQHLKPEGALVTKVFHGSGYSQIVEAVQGQFRVVKPLKPKASRDKSSETFLVGFGLKNAAPEAADDGHGSALAHRAENVRLCAALPEPCNPVPGQLTGLESSHLPWASGILS